MLFVLIVGTLASVGCAALAPPPASSGGGVPSSVGIGSAANAPAVPDGNDPSLTITNADLVNPTTLSIVAQAQAIPDGTPLQLELLAADQPVVWLAENATTVRVTDGVINLRVDRSADAALLDCTQPLAVRLSGQVNGITLDPTYALTIPTIYQAEVCLPPQAIPAEIDGIPTIAAAELPPEARETMRLIARGGPFPYRKDGTIFQNRERLLPLRPEGYYREYTVRTPGAANRGARRIVSGSANELYYTDDHYASFRRIVE